MLLRSRAFQVLDAVSNFPVFHFAVLSINSKFLRHADLNDTFFENPLNVMMFHFIFYFVQIRAVSTRADSGAKVRGHAAPAVQLFAERHLRLPRIPAESPGRHTAPRDAVGRGRGSTTRPGPAAGPGREDDPVGRRRQDTPAVEAHFSSPLTLFRSVVDCTVTMDMTSRVFFLSFLLRGEILFDSMWKRFESQCEFLADGSFF